MTPEDVLVEAIVAAALYGDTPELRETQCRRLREVIGVTGIYYIKDSPTIARSNDH